MSEESCDHPAGQADEHAVAGSVDAARPDNGSPVSLSQPVRDQWAAAGDQQPGSPVRSVEGLPWEQLAVFLIVFLIFASIVLALVALGQNLAVAVGVPTSLSAVALGVLSKLGMLARRDKN